MNVSALILTFNEESSIAACLGSLAGIDDIVVVDSGSTDRTCVLAEEHGARILTRPFDNFANQRNFGLDEGSLRHEWVLHLDADEVATPEFMTALKSLAPEKGVFGYRVPSKTILNGRWLQYSGMYPTYQVRLGHRDRMRFKQVGHGQREDLAPEQVGTFPKPYLHYNFSHGITNWLRKHVGYAKAEAKQLFRDRELDLQSARAPQWPDNAVSRPLPVTVAIPVKNEEANLAACLDRLSRFAEVVVIDSGSTDGTRAIAEGFGARVVDFAWDGKYPKKRNWFLLNDPPHQPWVLFLDADEFVDEAFCDALLAAVTNEAHTGYWLNYTNYFLGTPLRYGLAQRKLALFRVGKALYEKIDENGWSQLDMEIHEHPIVEGQVGEIKAPIDHRDYKGLGKFIEKHRDYALWEARRYKNLQENPATWQHFTGRQKFKYRHLTKWWYPWFYFTFTYLVKLGVLDGSAGFHYAANKAWYFQTIRLLIDEQSSKVK